MKRNVPTNKNSHIVSRIDRRGNLRTETSRRDPGTLDVAVSTDPRSNSTRVYIDVEGRSNAFGCADLELSGHQALTLYRTLARHFQNTNNPAQYL